MKARSNETLDVLRDIHFRCSCRISTELAVLNVSQLVNSATARPIMVTSESNCAPGGAWSKPAFPTTRLLGASCPVRYKVQAESEGALGVRTRGVRCVFAPMSRKAFP